MTEQQNLPALHATLAISLPAGTCSPALCPPHKTYFRTAPFILPSHGAAKLHG